MALLTVVDYHHRCDEVNYNNCQRHACCLVIGLDDQVDKACQQISPDKELKLAIVDGVVDHVCVPCD